MTSRSEPPAVRDRDRGIEPIPPGAASPYRIAPASPWFHVLNVSGGFRFDEPARWRPALYQACEVAYPMVEAGVTAGDVAAFWRAHPYERPPEALCVPKLATWADSGGEDGRMLPDEGIAA